MDHDGLHARVGCRRGHRRAHWRHFWPSPNLQSRLRVVYGRSDIAFDHLGYGVFGSNDADHPENVSGRGCCDAAGEFGGHYCGCLSP